MNSVKINFTSFLYLVSMLLFSFCSSCKDEKYDRVNFISIEITNVESIALDSVLVQAEVTNFDELIGTVRSYGFLWSTSDEPLTIETFEVNERLGALSGDEPDGKFEIKLRLEPNRDFSIRAYATADNERYFYSETNSHKTGTGTVITQKAFYPGGFQLEVKGDLFGIRPNLTVVQHGFCWSTTTENPNLNSDTVQLGGLAVEGTFSSQIPLDIQLDGNPYHYRAYAIYKNSISETVVFGEVQTFDGDLNYWLSIDDFPGLAVHGTSSFTIDDKAYVGGGWPNTETSIDEFWEFDPVSESWTAKSGAPFTQYEIDETRRINAVGFSVNTVFGSTTHKYGFIGTGTVRANAGRAADFYRYDVMEDSWTSMNAPSDMRTTKGVSFTIDHFSYVGLGEWFAYLLDDFWRYNPITDTWEVMASLPGPARTDPIAFSIGQKGYVGGGRTREGTEFFDFYEYDHNNNIWTRKGDLPEEFVNGATFVLDGRAYVSDQFSSETNFWEYDTVNDNWIQRADMPVKTDLAFVVNGTAYAGLGWSIADTAWTHAFYKYVP